MQTTSATYQNSTFASTLTFGKSVSNAYRCSEFNNHLGNVLSVISDKPVAHDNGGTVDYWLADIRSSYDYSPFGVMLSGRTFETSQTICEDSTVTATQKALEEGFGNWSAWIPYKVTGGGPIGGSQETRLTYLSDEMQINADRGGNIGAHKTFTTGSGLHSVSFDITGNTCHDRLAFPPMSSPRPINVYIKDSVTNTIIASASYTTAGSYSLSFTPTNAGMIYKIEFYMSNANLSCQFSVDNVLITYQESSTTTVCKEIENSYRYAFQGQERDDEIKGKGKSYNFEYRMHDSRLGRFFAVDPLRTDYPMLTPYQFSSNSPVYLVEIEGLEGTIYVYKNWYGEDGKVHSEFINKYTVDGLNADVNKIGWKEYNNPGSETIKYDYLVKMPNGENGGGIINVEPSNRPNSAKELNQALGLAKPLPEPDNKSSERSMFSYGGGGPIELLFGKEAAEKVRVAGAKLEGNSDPANTGVISEGDKKVAKGILAAPVVVGMAIFEFLYTPFTGASVFGPGDLDVIPANGGDDNTFKN